MAELVADCLLEQQELGSPEHVPQGREEGLQIAARLQFEHELPADRDRGRLHLQPAFERDDEILLLEVDVGVVRFTPLLPVLPEIFVIGEQGLLQRLIGGVFVGAVGLQPGKFVGL